jgi:hypothetical protein
VSPEAVLAAPKLDRQARRQTALERTWDKAAGQFLSQPVRARGGQDLIPPTAAAQACS